MSEIIRGQVDAIAFGGEGILRDEGLVVFVPYALPGDQVTVEITQKKKRHATGKLLEITQPSPQRITPLCPYFGTCGGCQFQNLDYLSQLEIKRRFIQDALERIGKASVEVPPVTPATAIWSYRRHIRLNLRPNHPNSLSAGYIGWDHQAFVEPKECPIFAPLDDPILEDIQEFIQKIPAAHLGESSLKIFKASSGKYLPLFFFSSGLPKDSSALAEAALKRYPQWEGIILHTHGKKLSFGNTRCTLDLLGLNLEFSPFGFVQNHPEQSENLYRAILENTPASVKKALDLFCGIGATSLLFAKRGIEVLGVESHAETVELARENARKNDLPNAQFQVGQAEEICLQKIQPDLILCNPPRTGLDPALIQSLLESPPEHLIYVSCMPSTLARDLKPLLGRGYAIEKVQGFDMFPQTTHVETLVHCKLKSKNSLTS